MYLSKAISKVALKWASTDSRKIWSNQGSTHICHFFPGTPAEFQLLAPISLRMRFSLFTGESHAVLLRVLVTNATCQRINIPHKHSSINEPLQLVYNYPNSLLPQIRYFWNLCYAPLIKVFQNSFLAIHHGRCFKVWTLLSSFPSVLSVPPLSTNVNRTSQYTTCINTGFMI